MKYWLSHLLLEVWVDVFRYPGKSRQELGQMVDRIGNRKYSEYLQFYLHDWGRRTLKMVWIEKGWKVEWELAKEIPETPLPANIKSFEYIRISHFDARTIAFLGHMGPLLADVKLDLTLIESGLRTILANLAPLLPNGSIRSLDCNVCALPAVSEHFCDQQLANLKVLKMRQKDEGMDEAMQQENVNFIVNWLTSSSAGPKLFECKFLGRCLDPAFAEQVFKVIREQFLAAKTPSTFAMIFNNHSWGTWEFADFQLENGIGEELHGVWVYDARDSGFGIFQITRHQADCGPQLREWVKENMKQQGREIQHIEFWWQPTIGLLDAIDPPVNEDEDNDQQEPSTSKGNILWVRPFTY